MSVPYDRFPFVIRIRMGLGLSLDRDRVADSDDGFILGTKGRTLWLWGGGMVRFPPPSVGLGLGLVV